MTDNTIQALDLTILDQKSTLSSGQILGCKSSDNSVIVAINSMSGTTLSIYQVDSSQITQRSVPVDDSYYFSSCIVLTTSPIQISLVAILGSSSRLHSIVIASPINSNQPQLSSNTDKPYKYISHVPGGAAMLATNEIITNQAGNLQIKYGAFLSFQADAPKFLALASPNSYYLFDSSSDFPAFILKCLENQTYIYQTVESSGGEAWNSIYSDASQSLIGIPIKNQNLLSREIFYNRDLQVMTSNLGNYRFSKFSQVAGQMIVASQSEACLASFTAGSSISITTQACFPIQSINVFQEIYMDQNSHYFFNGSHFLQKTDSVNESGPSSYFPNEYWSDDNGSLIDLGNIYLPLSSNEILIVGPDSIILSKPEIKSGQNTSSDILSAGAIVGIAIGAAVFLILVLFLIWFCCFRNKSNNEQEGKQPEQQNDGHKSNQPIIPHSNIPGSSSKIQNFNSFSEQCGICLIQGCDHMLSCRHQVHLACLKDWIKAKKKSKCPACNQEIQMTAELSALIS